jgi:hypothetical protein
VEQPATFWDLAPLWIALVALVVFAVAVGRVWRSRAARVAVRKPEPALSQESDPNAVDSSHIGFAPLVSSALQQAPLHVDAATRGEDSDASKR